MAVLDYGLGGDDKQNSPKNHPVGGVPAPFAQAAMLALVDIGDLASRSQLAESNGLTHEEQKRATGLNLNSERIQKIALRRTLADKLLSSIDNPDEEFKLGMTYVQNVYRTALSPRNRAINPQCTDEIRQSLIRFIRSLFENNTKILELDVPFVAPYHGISSHILQDLASTNIFAIQSALDLYSTIMSLLHMWYICILEKREDLVGSLVQIGASITDMEMKMLDIQRQYTLVYTARGNVNTGISVTKHHYTAMFRDANNWPTSSQIGCKNPGKMPPVFTSLCLFESTPNITPRDQLAMLEEMYLFEDILGYIGASPEVLELFFRKHYLYLTEAGLPESWLGNPDIEKLWNRINNKILKKTATTVLAVPPKTAKAIGSPRKKVKKPKSQARPPTPESKPIYLATTPTKSTRSSYPLPDIKDKFKEELQNPRTISCIYHLTEICPNIPADAMLHIGVQVNATQVTWLNTRDATVKVSAPNPGRTKEFVFCFTGTGENPAPKNPLRRISITMPKGEASSIQVVPAIQSHVDDIFLTTPGVIPTDTQGRGPIQSIITEDEDHTKLALELLGLIEQSKVILSGLATSIIHGVFEQVTRETNIGFTYKQDSKSVDITGCSDAVKHDIHDELLKYIQEKVKEYREQMDTRITKKLSNIQQELLRRFTILHQSATEDTTLTPASYRFNDKYFSGIYLCNNNKKTTLNQCIANLQTLGIHVMITKEGSNELSLSVSLEGEPHVSGKIVSKNISPYYEFQGFDSKIYYIHGRSLANTLIELLMLLGLAGKMQYARDVVADEKQKNRQKTQSPEIDINAVLSGTHKKNYRSWESYTQSERDLMKQTITRLEKGEGRQMISGGYSDTHGYYQYHIEGHKSLTDYSEDQRDNIMIVVCDEKTSSVPDGRSGQPHVYDMLRTNDRLQKYWILKMIATVKGSVYKGKSPFTNGIGNYFQEAWKNLSDDKKKEFLELGAGENGKASKLLNFKSTDTSEKSFLMEFIDGAQVKGIPLIYSQPKIVPLSELLGHRNNIQAHQTKTSVEGRDSIED